MAAEQSTSGSSIDAAILRVQFVTYRNPKLFRAEKHSSYITSDNTQILMAKIGESGISNLSTPVLYTMDNPEDGEFVCAYWLEEGRTILLI